MHSGAHTKAAQLHSDTRATARDKFPGMTHAFYQEIVTPHQKFNSNIRYGITWIEQ
jgi:hypothetical protein